MQALLRSQTKVIPECDIHDRYRMNTQRFLFIQGKIKKTERMCNSCPETGMGCISHGIFIQDTQCGQVLKGGWKGEFQKMLPASGDFLSCRLRQSIHLLLQPGRVIR